MRKRSRFIAFAYPVATEEEAAARVDALRREYRDARHVAYAYRVFSGDMAIERADDAGEPARSAGWPVLELLRGKDLVNVLVAVVRYFGGVKLGIGGLRRAYRDAAAEALRAAGIAPFRPRARLRLRFGPEHSGHVFPLLARCGGKVVERGFRHGAIVIVVELPAEWAGKLGEAIRPWGNLERLDGTAPGRGQGPARPPSPPRTGSS